MHEMHSPDLGRDALGLENLRLPPPRCSARTACGIRTSVFESSSIVANMRLLRVDKSMSRMVVRKDALQARVEKPSSALPAILQPFSFL